MTATGYALSVIGSREKNQDSFLIDNDRGFFAVADGVGGGLHGEVASKMSVDGFAAHAPKEGSLRPVVEKLQADVLREAMKEIGEALMGTTFTAVRVTDSIVSLVHVGDSHCYWLTEGVLRVMTEDHESYDETLQSPVLSSYLGIPSDIHPLTIQEESFVVKPGDRLLLCSDGLYRQMIDSRIAALIKELGDSPEKLLQKLCSEASAAEYSDNVTVVYVEIT